MKLNFQVTNQLSHPTFHIPHSSFGFTLIELIVVISIMVLITGGGIAGYLNYQDKQTLLSDVEMTRNLIQKARARAQAGDLGHSDCAYLDGYRVRGIAHSGVVQLYVDCRDGANFSQTYTLQTEVLDSQVSLVNEFEIAYKTLGQGVTGFGQIGFITDSGRAYSFEVDEGGSISNGFLTEPESLLGGNEPTPTPIAAATPTPTPDIGARTDPTPTPLPTPLPTPIPTPLPTPTPSPTPCSDRGC